MHSKTRKRLKQSGKKKSAGGNGKPSSFRRLAAFGLWADRVDVKDPVKFTQDLRRKMEQGSDA